jgi:hypothetical protein
MNWKLAAFGIVIASILLAEQAQPQPQPSRAKLRGINQIGLTVEVLSEVAKECRISEALIRDAFMYPASSARFAVKENVLLPYMYFNIITLKPVQLCASAIDMSFRVSQGVKLEASGQFIFATIELWNDGGLRVSSNHQHGQAVRNEIEEETKKFITAWNLDNR